MKTLFMICWCCSRKKNSSAKGENVECAAETHKKWLSEKNAPCVCIVKESCEDLSEHLVSVWKIGIDDEHTRWRTVVVNIWPFIFYFLFCCWQIFKWCKANYFLCMSRKMIIYNIHTHLLLLSLQNTFTLTMQCALNSCLMIAQFSPLITSRSIQ